MSIWRAGALNPQQTPETARTVEARTGVVINEDAIEAAVAEDGAAQPGDFFRRLQPALRLRVKAAQLLQLAILLFVQRLNAHARGHVQHVAEHRQTFVLAFFLPLPVV